MLVTVLNNINTYQTSQTAELNSIQASLTAANAQTQADLGGDQQVLARDVLNANAIQSNLTTRTAFWSTTISTANTNAATLARDLAVGYSYQPIVCTIDTNGIVTRTDTGTIVRGMKISPPPKS